MDSLIRRYFEDMQRDDMQRDDMAGGMTRTINRQNVRGILHYYSENDTVCLIDLKHGRIYRLSEKIEMTYLRWGCDDVPVRLKYKSSNEDEKPKWYLTGTCMSNSGMNGMIVTASLDANIRAYKYNKDILGLGFHYKYHHNPNVCQFSKTYPYSQYHEFSRLNSILSELGTKERDIYTVYIMFLLKDVCIDDEILRMIRELSHQADAFWQDFYTIDECRDVILTWLTELELYLYEQKQKTPLVMDEADETEPKGIRYYMDNE